MNEGFRHPPMNDDFQDMLAFLEESEAESVIVVVNAAEAPFQR